MVQLAGYIAAAIVFGIGLFGVLTQRDMIKICVSLSVMDSALILAVVSLAYRSGGAAPIIDGNATVFVDPLPHALALTAIVIGAGVLSVALALAVVIYARYGTTDIAVVFRRRR